MNEILLDLVRRLTSRKFIIAGVSYILLFLQGLDVIALSEAIQSILASALPGYVLAEGTSDAIERYKSNHITP